MFKLNRIRLLVVILLIGSLAVSSQIFHVDANAGIPDAPDAKQIMGVMDRAYQLIGHASQTFDVSEFPSVFIDTEDYKFTDKQKEALSEVLGVSVAEVESTGYLTAMQAQYITRGQGAVLLRAALDKAKLENRKLTAEEFQEIVKANHGQVPSLGSAITTKTELVFESIEINGNKAIVRYDDGAALQEAILVKEARWLIASIVPIWTHY